MESVAIYINLNVYSYLLKVFGVETLALNKCCWVAKCLEKLLYQISTKTYMNDTLIFLSLSSKKIKKIVKH